MDRGLALGMLGLEPSATPEEIERAYWEKCAELEDRIRIAPTGALKKVYRDALEGLEEARAAALGLDDAEAAEAALVEGASPVEDEWQEPEEEVAPEEPAPPEEEQPLEQEAISEEVPPEETAPPQEEAPPEEPVLEEEGAPELPAPPAEEAEVAPAEPELTAVEEPSAPEAEEPPAEEAVPPEAPVTPTEAGETSAALSAAETEVGFLEGQILLERYDVRYRIGLGRTGAVYAVYDLSAQKNLAIKVLLPGLLQDEAVRQRFASEVKVAIYLSHPNITQVFELSHDGSTNFLVMELLKGRTLREEMEARKRARKPFSVQDVARVGVALCDALHYAHEYVVHGWVKPENVFLCEDGTVKLTDFAIASLVPPREGAVPEGSMAYLAPEQRTPEGGADRRADQFAVAAVLYEMLIGEVPPVPAPPAKMVREDLPEEVAAAIDRALLPARQARFPSMSAFGERLAVAKGRPILQSLIKEASPGMWAAVGAVALVLVAVVASFIARPAKEDRPPVQVVEEDKRVVTAPPVDETARLATVRARDEADRLAREQAESLALAQEAERNAMLAQAEAERVATIRAKAEVERLAAAARAKGEAARLTATRAAAAVAREQAELRAAEDRRMATRMQAEIERTVRAEARAEVRRVEMARAQAEADARATARAEVEQERVATAEAKVEAERAATRQARAQAAQRTARAVAQATIRAVATVRQGELNARPNYVPIINGTVTSLRFFEKAPSDQVAADDREYADRFKATDTRGVFWEVNINHPRQGRRRNLTIRSVCYGPRGKVFGEGELETYVEGNWGTSKHIYGWGFEKSDKWRDGTYKVELFVSDKKIAGGSFKIYSGLF